MGRRCGIRWVGGVALGIAVHLPPSSHHFEMSQMQKYVLTGN